MGEGTVTIGVTGKHPAWGDFIGGGLSIAVQDRIDRWLRESLAAIRTDWGEEWDAAYDASPVIGFWFGSHLAGETGPVTGLIVPSRDKVGRRFPLVVAVAGADMPAPVLAPPGPLYAALWSVIEGFQRGPGQEVADLAFALMGAVGDLPPAPAFEPGFWAARADSDMAQLWSDVAAVDHARAAAGRSYLWVQGAGGSAVHAAGGLPDHAMLGWLMRDAVAVAPPDEQDNETTPAAEPQLQDEGAP